MADKTINDIYDAIKQQHVPFYKRAEVLAPILVVGIPIMITVAIQWGVSGERMSTHEKRIANVEQSDTQQWRRLNNIEVSMAEATTTLRAIQKSVTNIEDRLRHSNVASK